MKFMVVTCFIMGIMIVGVSVVVLAETGESVSVGEACPTNLSALDGKMETILGSIFNETFKKTMRTSLHAPIPEAIQRADGINAQLNYLHAQIREQDRSQSYAENVARKAANNMREDLVACELGEKGSYCDAVEQYYTAMASNIANQGFLDALQCYQQHGVR